MIRKFYIACFLCCLAPGVRAQQLWTLHDCMVYAVNNAPNHKIQELNNEITQREYRDSYLALVPAVSGSTGLNTSFGRSIDPSDNTYKSRVTFNNSYSVSGRLNIFNGLEGINTIRSSKIAKLRGAEESQRIIDEISLTAMQAYFFAIHAQGLVELAREQLAESRQRLKEAQVKEELGLTGYAELLQIESEVAQSEFNLTRQENSFEEYLLQLKEVMFFPLDKPLRIDTTTTWAVNLLEGRESRDSIFRDALGFLPEARIAEFNVRTAELRYSTAKWQLLPILSANGGYGTSYFKVLKDPSLETGETIVTAPFKEQFKDNAGQWVGATLSIPIFGGLARQSAIARTRREVKIAEHERDQTRQQIEAAIQRAIQEMDGRMKEYVQSVKSVIAAEEANEVNRRKYEEGLITLLELQTSSNLLLEARVQRLNCMLNYQIKRREVNYYKGTPYIEQAN